VGLVITLCRGESTQDVTGPLSALNAPRKEHLDTKELSSFQSKGNQNISLLMVVTSDAAMVIDFYGDLEYFG
jgi:hypothetical protein